MAIEIETFGAIAVVRQGQPAVVAFEFPKEAANRQLSGHARLCLACVSQHVMDFLKKDMSRERDRGLRGQYREEVNWDDIEIGKPYPMAARPARSKRTRARTLRYLEGTMKVSELARRLELSISLTYALLKLGKIRGTRHGSAEGRFGFRKTATRLSKARE